jgi:hypothetical protein
VVIANDDYTTALTTTVNCASRLYVKYPGRVGSKKGEFIDTIFNEIIFPPPHCIPMGKCIISSIHTNQSQGRNDPRVPPRP